tara:strand:+ start:1679 stop:3124 length:1446 start_codon:yes stop_codon:yes gene_type:complete
MKNRPVVIGIGTIQQKGNFDELDEALILMDRALKNAIDDTTNTNIKNYIDEIQIPKGYWRYRDPARWIAENNEIKDVKTSITKIGVLQQNLINSTCNKILKGKIRAGLILGGEARYKLIRSYIEKKEYVETELNINPDNYVKAKDELHLKIEEDTLGLMAVGYYGILESALRSSLNTDFNHHHENISEMYSEFSKIASKNTDSWMDNPIEAKEILNQSKKNPLQAFPYNKFHCSSWNVNQSCALIICSEEIANKLNVPIEKRVYPIASSESNHMIATLQRPNLIEPYGMKMASNFILEICKTNNIKPNMYDLYSCFPVAVQMFSRMLNVKRPENMTITGGMPFAGGPLNSYVLHSTIKMISKIREQNNNIGIITGVSGMMTKQSFALWAKNPIIEFLHKDFSKEASINEIPIDISMAKEGSGKIIGYTTVHNKNPKAIIYIDCEDGKRKLITSSDESIIKSMETEEWVKRKIYFKQNQLVH